MRRTLFLAVGLSVAACASDATVGARQTPPPAPPPTAADPTLDELGIAPLAGCPQPFGPVHAVAGVYGGQPTTVGEQPPEGESIDVLARRYTAPDTDGDGAPDEVAAEGEALVVRRAAGDVVLARTGAVVGPPGGMTWIGDLDDDGRDEIVAYASRADVPGELETYLVPGTVAAGTHDPATVGIRLPWQPNTLLWAVGDHDGDGGEDVLVPGDTGPVVVPGHSLLAPGPGGTVDGPPSELRDAPADLIGVLELRSGVPPVFVTASDVGGAGDTRIEVDLHTDPVVQLRIGGLEPIGGGWGSTGAVGGYRSGGDRIITYAFSGGRSGFGGTWYWNLDDPCAGFASAPLAPAPAAPTVADPRVAVPGVLPATG